MNPITLPAYARQALLPAAITLLLTCTSELRAQDQADGADKPIQMKMDYQPNACSAHLGVEYFQRGNQAHVKTELTNDDCAASAGTYTVRVRFKGEDGEIKSVDHPETWSRTDALPIEREKDYLIGDNVDLINVRTRNLKCECAVEATQP